MTTTDTTASTNPKETTVTNPAPNTTVEPSQTAETDPKGTPAPEGIDPAVETGEEAVEGSESDDTESKDVAALKDEAKKRRRELRAVEAERNQLAEAVKGYQRTEAERLAVNRSSVFSSGLLNGADLWMAGVTLEELLTEDGKVDAAKVRAAVKTVTAARPYLRRGGTGIGQGRVGAGADEPDGVRVGGTGWSSVLKGDAK
jgi:hypothetical protein